MDALADTFFFSAPAACQPKECVVVAIYSAICLFPMYRLLPSLHTSPTSRLISACPCLSSMSTLITSEVSRNFFLFFDWSS
jgi:hypothetical protein